ncbi:hypothetical protein AV274_3061 [Blastocystis sp. ATCC 50177/Nand II]|uniref:Exocyst complex component Sec10 N-terminal domain-containing protein n=1 Tax=Blastocystis sp. subtype 1 (strain ATCC 50177 / NandII) TaxID=478820 RepID=A0A196SGK2_BLAHN|nr:hypothetical protein AV274_3061 [Blastocystis sp. ATCC 50177/Nand II]
MADISRIFALGAQKQAQELSWRDFEGDFSETTFMDQVTLPAMLKEPSAEWDGRIDIKRLRNILDTAKSQIVGVQKTVDTMIEEQAEKCKVAEKTLQTESEQYLGNLDTLVENYNRINEKYTTVSSSSIAVGQTLKALNAQRERVVKAQRLLRNFLAFQEDENYMQELLLSDDQLLQGSAALQEVVLLCEGLDKNEYGTVIDRVNRRVQTVVDKLVESLQEATMNNDLKQLALITSCLSTFQKGMGVYQTYTSISLKKMKGELDKVELAVEKMFDDFLVYILQYFKCLTELFQKEVKTVYEIFDKDAVCQVIVVLVDRVFNDQTLGVQFLLAQVAGCPALSKEEKFELLAQIREASNKFYDEVVAAIAAKEKGLIGHAERITREEEGLKESLNNAFAQNMETYFHDELSTLEVAFKDIMANTLSLPINPSSSKSDIKTALKRMSPDGSAADVIKQFVTASLSPIAILEFFNTAARTLDILDGMVSSVTEVIFRAITEYITLVLDTVAVANARDYPATMLPGMTPKEPNLAIFDTIQTLNGVVHCVQQNYLTRIRSNVAAGSEDEQICEIEVKKMYIAVERRVSQLLQEELRQVELYVGSLFDVLAKENTYQPPSNVGITRASDVCYSAEAVLLVFQKCFYESLMKIKKISNTGILLLELDISCYEETLLQLNMESATIFVRVMKKLLHLVSIPQSLLKGHIQDSDVQSLDRKYVVQVLKLRSDFYRSEEVRELCRDVEANEV